jgi:hypothetical protein
MAFDRASSSHYGVLRKCGPPKRATQEVDSPVKHSAVVALRRLSHPERHGGCRGGNRYPNRSSTFRTLSAMGMEDDSISQLFGASRSTCPN